jgi:hypothetical protein
LPFAAGDSMLGTGSHRGSRMVRKVVAVVLGIVAALATVMGVEAASALAWPPPPGLDYKDLDQMRAFIEGMPLAAKSSVVVAWLLAAFVGGLVTVLVARHKTRLAVVPGLIIAAATIANAMMLPHPLWMPVTGVLLAVPMAWLGGWIGGRWVTPRVRDGGTWTGGTR